MDKFIDGHLKTEIKQLISMQTLLEQYDRENKFLNKQVLQLLEQNKSLKIDKIKNNIVTQLTDISRYKKKNKVSKQNNQQPITAWKELRTSEKNKEVPKQQKDEAIQVTSRIDNSSLSQLREISFHKQYSSDAFSFGSPTGRDSPQDPTFSKQRKQVSPKGSKKNTASSPEKMPDTDHKQSFKIELLRSPIEQFDQNEKSKLQDSRTFLNVVHHKQDLLSSQSSSILRDRKCQRSSHAIEPSPKIEPSKSFKNLHVMESQTSIQRAASYSHIARESVQRRRKFINVVSSKEKRIKWQLVASERNLGC